MPICYACICGNDDGHICGKPKPKSIASDCSGADAGAIGCEAISAGPSVPGDSLRKIRELAGKAIMAFGTRNYRAGMDTLHEIREICSNENSIPSDAE